MTGGSVVEVTCRRSRCGHRWQARPAGRFVARRCPSCGHRTGRVAYLGVRLGGPHDA